MSYIYGKRPDGFGNNIWESGGSWHLVFICPECGFNAHLKPFESEDAAVEAMDFEIQQHKYSKECSYEWIAEAMEDAAKNKEQANKSAAPDNGGSGA